MSDPLKPGVQIGGWTVHRPIGGGGQGDTYLAADQTGRQGCLKILAGHPSRERRQRFAREATCYETLAIDGVPSLLDSNAVQMAPIGGGPIYLCTDFVEGCSLDRLPKGKSSATEVISAVDRLTWIVYSLHENGIVHRDIKPQNIVARGKSLPALFLVDFGLAFDSVADDENQTEIGQELGNRFLRLPELMAGSRMKQDPASDIAFCVGILFYLVTGLEPRQLIDGAGQMPHQRDEVRATRLHSETDFRALMPVFDRGFALRASERFASIQELRNALRRPMTKPMSTPKSLDEIIGELKTPAARSMQARRNHRNQVLEVAHLRASQIAQRLNGTYLNHQWAFSTSDQEAATKAGFALGSDHSVVEDVAFVSKVVGSEIVVTADGTEILRVDADTPDWGATLTPAIDGALEGALARLHARVTARPI